MRLIIYLISIFLVSCESETQAPIEKVIQPVKTMVLTSPDNAQLVDRVPGKVMASQRAELKFQVPGKLMEFSIKESQKVAKGDLLARLDPRNYKTNLTKVNSQISQARAKLKAMKIGARPEDVKVLQAELAAARAKFQEAKQQYERYQGLWKKRVIPKAEYDRQESTYNVAKAQLNTAKQTLNKGKIGARKEDLEAMQSSIKGLLAQREEAQNALDDTYLKAPFSGVIAKTFVKNFQSVEIKDPILSLQDISKLEIIINVPEQIVISSKEPEFYNFVAEFEAAKGRTFPLELKEYKVEADQKTQTYRAVFTMQAPKDLKILPGMTTTMLVTEKATNSTSKIFLAPVSAVFADEFNKQYVWIVQSDMTVRKREIMVGELTKGNIQLLSGVNSGERIVTAGVHFLQDGMEVKLFDSKAGY
ncbi:MAG: efflux RND transporter periplasmic adaptor subunit [Candidatus Marithrix sp.]